MSLIPAKYRFFAVLPNVGERELFPLYDPGSISFTYQKFNDYTNDFKVSLDNDLIFVDDTTKSNTSTQIYRAYTFFKNYANSQIQNIEMTVREFQNGIYVTIINGILVIMDTDTEQFCDNQKKFIGKIQTTSKHQTIENIWNTEINILDTNPIYKQTATLVSETQDYDNCFEIGPVIDYILSQTNSGVTLAADPFPFIASDIEIVNLLIADKTDIKRPNATSNATINKLKLINFIEWFYNMFALKYRINESNELYFEHESERPTSSVILTTSQILNYKDLKHGFDEYPKSIKFAYEESANAGFLNQIIENDVNEGAQIDKKNENINCDLQFIIDNAAAIGADPDAKDEVADVGVCFIGADASLNIYEDGGVYNARLQLDYLIEKAFYYNLFFDNFTLNGVDVSINSNRKRKKSIIKLKKYSNFNVNSLLQSDLLGTLEIIEAKHSGDNMQLTVIY